MKQNDLSLFEGILAGFFLGFSFAWLLKAEEESRRERAERQRKLASFGFQQDRQNISGDWNTVLQNMDTEYTKQQASL